MVEPVRQHCGGGLYGRSGVRIGEDDGVDSIVGVKQLPPRASLDVN